MVEKSFEVHPSHRCLEGRLANRQAWALSFVLVFRKRFGIFGKYHSRLEKYRLVDISDLIENQTIHSLPQPS